MNLQGFINNIHTIYFTHSALANITIEAACAYIPELSCKVAKETSSLISKSLECVAASVLIPKGLTLIKKAYDTIRARDLEPQPPIRARRNGGRLEFYRPPVPFRERILKTTKKIINAAFTAYIGFQLAKPLFNQFR